MKSDYEKILKALDKKKRYSLKSKKNALEILYECGIVNKKGKLKKYYKNLPYLLSGEMKQKLTP